MTSLINGHDASGRSRRNGEFSPAPKFKMGHSSRVAKIPRCADHCSRPLFPGRQRGRMGRHGQTKRRTIMTIIGTFYASDEGFTGNIETITLQTKATFERVQNKASEKSPDYRIFTRKSVYEIGAAWQSRVPDTGAPVLSVKLDDPSFAEPAHCRLVRDRDERTYHLIWERNRKRG
jgi:uncharacterized protein (DUF736 family)